MLCQNMGIRIEVIMPDFSSRSRARLDTCSPSIQRVFWEVVRFHDCTVIEGHRTRERQNELFNATPQRTKVMWPNSKHNGSPSDAADVGPYIAGRGIPWPDKKKHKDTYIKDLAQFYYFAGIVIATAKSMDIILRWGGDWDRDNTLTDQTFDDLVHFEVVS